MSIDARLFTATSLCLCECHSTKQPLNSLHSSYVLFHRFPSPTHGRRYVCTRSLSFYFLFCWAQVGFDCIFQDKARTHSLILTLDRSLASYWASCCLACIVASSSSSSGTSYPAQAGHKTQLVCLRWAELKRKKHGWYTHLLRSTNAQIRHPELLLRTSELERKAASRFHALLYRKMKNNLEQSLFMHA